MTHAIEMALRLFSPKGALHEPSSGRSSALGREEFLGALQVAAKSNPQGLQFLMADHQGDEQAQASLLAHFSTTLGSEEAGGMALAILLRRPLPEQMDRLVLSHPHYDKERRRAAVVMEKAKRAHRGGNDHEYQRLLAERNEILQLAHDHCVAEMLRSGRCPHCKGTGVRPRKGDDCPKCHGSGRVVPDAELVSRRFGLDMRQAVERAVDEVIHQASDLSKLMDRQVREMRAA
ncbi:TIGR02642 family protein [Aeromonas caviae]|uniref:TIGR02642 family protein n=1 Tax=Aeromonas caviae TaxID=648 RepID=UPI0029D4D28A|nr:TIGR02642 family protein [Aeromonas caviae]MDX7690285.1 TIGR02642 family protein [Aeromonas caviae]